MKPRAGWLCAMLVGACGKEVPTPTTLVQMPRDVQIWGFARSEGRIFWATLAGARAEVRAVVEGSVDQFKLDSAMDIFEAPAARTGVVYWSARQNNEIRMLRPGDSEASRLFDRHATSIVACEDSLVIGSSQGRIFRLPLDGNPAIEFSDGGSQGDRVAALCLDSLCWTSHLPSGGVFRAPRDGGGAEMLASGMEYPDLPQADDTYLYWVTRGHELDSEPPGAVFRQALGGGPVETVHAAIRDPEAMAMDDTNLYIAVGLRAGGGSIIKLPKTGGDFVTLVEGLDEPTGIDVDGEWVYFSTVGGYDGGSIMKVRKDTETIHYEPEEE